MREAGVGFGPVEGRANWADKTADEILEDIRKTVESIKQAKFRVPGVTAYAGKSAYEILRRSVPADTEILKIKECEYLGDHDCFLAKNEGLIYLMDECSKLSDETVKFLMSRRPDSSDSCGCGQPTTHSE